MSQGSGGTPTGAAPVKPVNRFYGGYLFLYGRAAEVQSQGSWGVGA